MQKKTFPIIAGAAAIFMAVAASSWAQGGPKPGTSSAQGELDALVKAARAEGEVLLYTSTPEAAARRVAAAFQEKYAVKVAYVRLSSAQLAQRYFTEAEAGNVVGDIVWTAGGGAPYTTDGIKKGFIEPISATSLPVVKSGQFPARFLDGGSAIVQISPLGIAYNTDKVKGPDVPKDWPDLLDPKWKGRILIPDPRSSPGFPPFWLLMREKYGDSFLTRLKAQEPRQYSSGIPGIQALAAGEGSIYIPVLASVYGEVQRKGAPVAAMTPPHTTGVQFHVVLTARNKSAHPNAARLLGNFVMSPDGNKVFNDEPGVAGVYDTTRLPKQFDLPKSVSAQQAAELVKLLGIQ